MLWSWFGTTIGKTDTEAEQLEALKAIHEIDTSDAHIDQFLAFLLSEVKRGNARWIFDEADHRKFPLLDSFDFQPVLVSL
jgi:hypothetical protein